MNKHASLVAVISFVLVFSGLANAQDSAPSPDFISRITGGIWEGYWFYTNAGRDNPTTSHAEMELKPDGSGIYNHVRNPEPYQIKYVIEGENSFYFISPTSGKKFVFKVQVNDKGEDALYGYQYAQPYWQIIMKRKKI
jgi:hypothetical protein